MSELDAPTTLGASSVIPPTVKGTAQPLPIATALPKGSTVGSTHATSINMATGKATPQLAALVIPKGVEWDKSNTLSQATVPGGRKAIATFIQDGDGGTFKFNDGGDLICRFDSIDADEVKHSAWTDKKGKVHKANGDQAFGQASKKNLSDMILNKEVTVTVTQSKEGRKFCQVFFEGKDVALEQVKGGFAEVYTKFIAPELATQFNAAEDTAKKAKKGMWANINRISPETFRRLSE